MVNMSAEVNGRKESCLLYNHHCGSHRNYFFFTIKIAVCGIDHIWSKVNGMYL